MLKLPTRDDCIPIKSKGIFGRSLNINESPQVTYFNNYNQDSFIECFQNFPNGAAMYVMNMLINFLGNNNIQDSFRVKSHNLSINDVMFANYTIAKISYLMNNSKEIDLDLDYMVDKQKIRTLNVRYVEDIYFRFYYFEDYIFHEILNNELRNTTDRKFAEKEKGHFFTLSYSLPTRLGVNKDTRIVDFFFDSKYNDAGNLIELFAKVIDSMLMEHLRRDTNKAIPFNTITNFAPPYIFFPEFITIDAIDFIYNYLFTTFNLFNNINIYIEYNGFSGNTTMSSLIKMARDAGALGTSIGFFDKDDYYLDILWKILMGEIDSDNAIHELYMAYRKEICKA